LSAHYRNPAFEGEDVQVVMTKPPAGARETEIRMVKRDTATMSRKKCTTSSGRDSAVR
jgi:hypothetical protein